jgi:hypothetical protein
MHVPLIATEGVDFRVANETRQYNPKQAMVFDDSFEHEVWHRGAKDRYVLYLTVHHPDMHLKLKLGHHYKQLKKGDQLASRHGASQRQEL